MLKPNYPLFCYFIWSRFDLILSYQSVKKQLFLWLNSTFSELNSKPVLSELNLSFSYLALQGWNLTRINKCTPLYIDEKWSVEDDHHVRAKIQFAAMQLLKRSLDGVFQILYFQKKGFKCNLKSFMKNCIMHSPL